MILTHIGRGLMALACLAAIGAFAGGLGDLAAAPPDRAWVEAWRTFGFLTFAGLFALLAWRPTRSPLMWELVFFHKAAMATAYFFLPRTPEAEGAVWVDVALCIVMLGAWE